MPGYNPRCDNCFTCATCKGEGWVKVPKSGKRPDGTYATWYEKETCPTCKGAGGRPGAGHHDHA